MTGYFDWLTAGDSGLSVDRLAEKFRISHNELQRLVEALAPAFTLGLRRSAMDPADWAGISRSFQETVARLYGGQEPAPAPALQGLMDQIFGSKSLAAAVARQASVASGIAPDTIEKLMPELAVVTMENFARMMMAHGGQGVGQPTSGNPGEAAAEMMRRAANAVEALSRPSGDGAKRQPLPDTRLFGSEYIERMFADALKSGYPWSQGAAPAPAGGASSPGEASPRRPDGADVFMPFGPIFEAFARGAQPAETSDGAGAAAPEPASAARPQGGDSAAGPSDSLGAFFDGMMRSGQKLQDDYARDMVALFERYQAKD